MKLRSKKKNWSIAKGFTLMELLIVIAIMAILVSLGAASYSTAQKSSRDARRRSDMKAIQNAVEQYLANTKAYPIAETDLDVGNAYFPGGRPVDPKFTVPADLYKYTLPAVITDTAGSSYCVCAKLEGSSATGNSTANTCAFTSSGPYFCVKSLQ